MRYLQQWVSRCFSLVELGWTEPPTSRVYTSRPYWPSSGKLKRKKMNLSMISLLKSTNYLIVNVTISSTTLCWTNFDNFFSSIPFLWRVAMKSVSGRDILNWVSKILPAKIKGSWKHCVRSNAIKHSFTTLTWWVMGTRPKSLVALVGPHSPEAQSGKGTMTVWSSSQQI